MWKWSHRSSVLPFFLVISTYPRRKVVTASHSRSPQLHLRSMSAILFLEGRLLRERLSSEAIGLIEDHAEILQGLQRGHRITHANMRLREAVVIEIAILGASNDRLVVRDLVYIRISFEGHLGAQRNPMLHFLLLWLTRIDLNYRPLLYQSSALTN